MNKEYLLEKEWITIDDKWYPLYKHPMVKGVELSLSNAIISQNKLEENIEINNIMRPTSFRFRVWDEQHKTFLKSYADKGLSFFVKSNGPKQKERLEGVDWFITAEQIDNPVRYRVSQYTGIKDGKGEMIYTGDIVKYYFASVDVENELRVCFLNGAFVLSHLNYLIYFSSLTDDELKDLKVIGNIYEPKEEE